MWVATQGRGQESQEPHKYTRIVVLASVSYTNIFRVSFFSLMQFCIMEQIKLWLKVHSFCGWFHRYMTALLHFWVTSHSPLHSGRLELGSPAPWFCQPSPLVLWWNAQTWMGATLLYVCHLCWRKRDEEQRSVTPIAQAEASPSPANHQPPQVDKQAHHDQHSHLASLLRQTSKQTLIVVPLKCCGCYTA